MREENIQGRVLFVFEHMNDIVTMVFVVRKIVCVGVCMCVCV